MPERRIRESTSVWEDDERIREIELRWPSGQVQVLEDIAADQVLEVREP